MNRLVREPLLHFVLAGVLLFYAYAWLDRGSGTGGKSARPVRITESEVAWLKGTWARQWQREPTREELRGLVMEFLKEELLAREARALGLDEDDIIVRRRLAQKMEFLVQDSSRLIEPTEEDLRRFFAANPERFQTVARVSFTHVYFGREGRADAAVDATKALAELAGGEGDAGAAELGDRLLLDAEFRDADEQTVAGQFGSEFARAVFALPAGGWQGPIESGYGLHLVRVSEAKPASRREFAEVKAKVLERWREQRLREDHERYFAGLLTKYEVVVDEKLKPLVGPLGDPLAAQASGSGEKGAK